MIPMLKLILSKLPSCKTLIIKQSMKDWDDRVKIIFWDTQSTLQVWTICIDCPCSRFHGRSVMASSEFGLCELNLKIDNGLQLRAGVLHITKNQLF